MATRETFDLTESERRRRIFSEDFKKQKVREIEQKITTVAQISKAYQVRPNNVYKWIDKYSVSRKKEARLIVEMESDTKKMITLQARIAELERVVGQKQLTIDFQAKMIELAELEYGVDIKKKSEIKPSSTFGDDEKSSQ